MLGQENKRRAKIIWSIESRLADADLAKAISGKDIDAIRLLYDRKTTGRIEKFIEAVNANKARGKPAIPFMVDLAVEVRGKIHGLQSPKEVAFGDKLRLTLPGGGGQLEIEAENWSSL